MSVLQLNNEWVKILIFIIKHWPLMTHCSPWQLTMRGPTSGNMIHRVTLYSLWVHTGVITPRVKYANLMTPNSNWIYEWSVYLQTYIVSCRCRTKHFWISVMRVRRRRVHGRRLWRHYLFTYSRYHFSSCQWRQSTNIPQCGLRQLRTCLGNSRQ